MLEEKYDIYVFNSYALTPKSVGVKTVLDFFLTYETGECVFDAEKTKEEKRRCFKYNKIYGNYAVEDESGIYYKIPRGLVDYLPDTIFNKLDETTHNLAVPSDDATDDELQALKEFGFILRDDQLTAVRNTLYYLRGINQLATGAGKSIIACDVMKLLIALNPKIKILLCVPYDQLINQFSEYFDKFKIKYILGTNLGKPKYEKQYKAANVVISTPITIGNRKEYLNDFTAVMFDEVQHLQSETWSTVAMKLENAEMSIGFSAKAIELEHINAINASEYSMEEGIIIGGTGKLITYIPASYYIKKGILATPILFSINNTLPAWMEKTQDWQRIAKTVLKDGNKLGAITRITNMFDEIDRRVLILTNTHEQSFALAEKIVEMSENPKMKVGVSHGNNEGFIYGWKSGKIQQEREKGNVVIDLFKRDMISVLIGTSHLDEGADLPDLDVCILAGLGKKSRRIIQRVGRSLRITKTGKYAYLIDFCDNGCNVLHKHYLERLDTYMEDIGIPLDRRFTGYEVSEVRKKVYQLEEII